MRPALYQKPYGDVDTMELGLWNSTIGQVVRDDWNKQ
jgi:hypothetical protein